MTAAREVLAEGGAAVLAGLSPAAVRRLPGGPRGRAQLALNRALKRRPRSFAAAATTLGFTVDGSTDDLIQRYLYVFGIWEPDLTHWVREHLRSGDVVVDVGANIGYYSLLAATVVGPTGKVLAFEAVPSIADLLERNVRRNDVPVDVHRVAVGDAPGDIEVFRSTGTNIGKSGTQASTGSTSEGTVTVVRGADAVPTELWSRVRLVKVDVEGDEARVLRGLVPLLEAMPDGSAVLAELTPDLAASRGGTADEVLDLMASLGFQPMSLRNSYAAADYARYTRTRPEPLSGSPTSQTDVIFVKRCP